MEPKHAGTAFLSCTLLVRSVVLRERVECGREAGFQTTRRIVSGQGVLSRVSEVVIAQLGPVGTLSWTLVLDQAN
ncbi:hypothetical protein NHX12_029471 [Muraenolepis orangiensis]|uniref:Secreted protein n=1 Tax=Muraenolepis orangiensis TaxID=630683 RepID=A0A9Q0EB79_9TELE|nr:hypothetical protein NHX12_029471 [Muraenolepis orangiensis]